MVKNCQNLSTNCIINTLYQKQFYYFNIKTFSTLFKISSLKSSQIFKRLEGKGYIKEIENGKYLLLGFEGSNVLSQPFFIATKILTPSYISFWSALNFYGLTEQVPSTTFVASPKKKKEVIFEKFRFKYVKISSNKFFGYRENESHGLFYLVAEPEKALIDSLDQPYYSGGIEEVFKCLYNFRENLSLKKIIEYAVIFNNKSLNCRLGYLLNKMGLNAERLKSHISKSYVKLKPGGKLGKLWDKNWKVNVNIPDKKLFEFKEIY